MQPAVLGGVFIGVLSSLPFVSNLNACCCLWVICGGVLTSYLLQERKPVALTAGDGALAGLLAGVIGALIAGLLGIAVAMMMGGTGPAGLGELPEGMPPEAERVLEQLRNLPPAFWYIGPFVIFLVVFPIFGMLGGLLGVAIFKKNPPPPPPGTVEILPPQ
jgi:hypothetical protein